MLSPYINSIFIWVVWLKKKKSYFMHTEIFSINYLLSIKKKFHFYLFIVVRLKKYIYLKLNL